MTNSTDAIPTGMRGTTILSVRTADHVVVIGDGQVTLGGEYAINQFVTA